MIRGKEVNLRPIHDKDWELIEEWGKNRDALYGPYQRFQLDHIRLMKDVYQKTGLLSRESGILLIETLKEEQVVGFVRYTMHLHPDAHHPHPEIGFAITDIDARGKGYGREGVALLISYLFSGYSTHRIVAYTDVENIPAQRLMEGLGFKREGTLRSVYFRDGGWHHIAIYSLLREEFQEA
jgi:ribosomal-protein-alanine N-acetyltransferase